MSATALALLLNLLLFVAGCMVAAGLLGQRRPLAVILSGALIAFCALVIGAEGLSLFRLMRVEYLVAWVSILLAGGVASLWRWRTLERDLPTPAHASPTPPRRWVPAGLLDWPALLTLVMGLWAAIYTLVRGMLTPVLVASDAPIYHLYFAIRWWKAGALDLVPTPFGEVAAPYFPANGDVWFTWLVMLTRNDLFAKVGQWPFLLLGALAIYGICRQLIDPREQRDTHIEHASSSGSQLSTLNSQLCSAAVFPPVAWATSTALLLHSSLANVDIIFAACYLVAVYFLFEYAADRRTSNLLCFGLACGAAVGTKSIALYFVPLLILPALALIWTRALRDGRRSVIGNLAQTGLLALAGLLPSAFWYARNWHLTGNPFYPLHAALLGHTLFPGSYDWATMYRASYYVPVTDWQAHLAMLGRVLDRRIAGLWAIAVVAGLALPLLRKNDSPGRKLETLIRRWPAALAALTLAMLAVYLLFIPYQNQTRFLYAAFGTALPPLALILARWRWLGWGVAALVAWHLFVPNQLATGAPVPFVPVELLLATFQQPLAASLLLLPVLIWAAIWLATVPRNRWLRVVPAATIVLATTLWFLSTAVSLAGYPPSFYPNYRDFAQSWSTMEDLAGPGARVAYSGTNIPYYLFGMGLRNDVRYVNINRHASFLLHDYDRLRRQHGDTSFSDIPFPTWDRTDADYDSWLANLRAARIDLLFLTRVNLWGQYPDSSQLDPTGLPRFPVEADWADRHPESFELVFQGANPEGRLWVKIYRVKP